MYSPLRNDLYEVGDVIRLKTYFAVRIVFNQNGFRLLHDLRYPVDPFLIIPVACWVLIFGNTVIQQRINLFHYCGEFIKVRPSRMNGYMMKVWLVGRECLNCSEIRRTFQQYATHWIQEQFADQIESLLRTVEYEYTFRIDGNSHFFRLPFCDIIPQRHIALRYPIL